MNLKQKLLLIFSVVFVIALLVSFIIFKGSIKSSTVSNHSSSPTINVTYNNFAEVMSKNYIINALPENSEVIITFYNFELGTRVSEKSYLLGEPITETTQETAEVIIFISSKYISELTNKNLCSILQKANRAGDLEIQSDLSTTSLAWKFRAMAKYKDCF